MKTPKIPPLTDKPTVELVVEGGIVQEVNFFNFPDSAFPVMLRIRDYDADVYDEEDIRENEFGEACFFGEREVTENGSY